MTKTKPKQSEIGEKLAEKTFKELGLDPKTGKPLKSPKSSYSPPKRPPFRIKALEKTKRQSPKGKAYKYSPLYRNAVILRLLVKKFTDGLSPKKYHRLIDQLNSSGRSVVREAVGAGLGGGEVAGDVDGYLLEAELLRRLVADVSDDDHAGLVHDDGLEVQEKRRPQSEAAHTSRTLSSRPPPWARRIR